jgi:hypothetical protein
MLQITNEQVKKLRKHGVLPMEVTEILSILGMPPTEPGAPLSDRECNKLNTSLYGGISAEAIAVINAVLANRNIRKEQPAPLDGYLIEKMCDAYNSDSGSSYSRSGMKAAARVIVDALLGPVTFNEAVKFGPGCQTEEERSFKVDAMLAARRGRIEAKPKTDAEKIADMLIAKGPDTPEAYRQVAAEIVEKLKADRTRKQ